MDKKKFYFEKYKDWLVFPDVEGYNVKGLKIVNIKKHFVNGDLLRHRETNEVFGISFFNAITERANRLILNAIDENKPFEYIDDLFEKYQLFQYMPESTERYKKWQIGDQGTGTLLKNNKGIMRIEFANYSLKVREEKNIE